MEKFNEQEFVPRKSIAKRYSLENIAKERGLTVEEFKLEIDNQLKMKQEMIDEQIKKGLTPEQVKTHVMRRLYIPGFSGPTFRD